MTSQSQQYFVCFHGNYKALAALKYAIRVYCPVIHKEEWLILNDIFLSASEFARIEIPNKIHFEIAKDAVELRLNHLKSGQIKSNGWIFETASDEIACQTYAMKCLQDAIEI